jgi:hypothetical protein
VRAHYQAPVQDVTGALLPGTVVSIYLNGTMTLDSEPVYADGSSNTQLGNPFVTATGVIDFYLASPERVDLGIQPPGVAQTVFPDIDVNEAEASSVTLTFPGAGASSTQVGASAAAGGTDTTAVGVSATASGIADTAYGEATTASGGSSLAVGQAATAQAFQSTAVGQGASAGSSASAGTSLGQGASTSGTNGTALGAGSSAAGTGATAVGQGASAGWTSSVALGVGASASANHQIMLGTAAEDVIIPGGLVLSESASPTTLTNGATMTWTGPAMVTVSAAGNITGLILAAGTVGGQALIVINESAFTLTFAVAGTSHVADGTSDVIAALTARKFVWDSNTSLWYRLA